MLTMDRVCTFLGFVFILICACAISALADPSGVPSGVPVVAAVVNSWTGKIDAFMAGGLIVSIAGLLEIVMRVVPTKAPLSIPYALEDIFKAIGNFFRSLGDAMDKVLPNRTTGGK